MEYLGGRGVRGIGEGEGGTGGGRRLRVFRFFRFSWLVRDRAGNCEVRVCRGVYGFKAVGFGNFFSFWG